VLIRGAKQSADVEVKSVMSATATHDIVGDGTQHPVLPDSRHTQSLPVQVNLEGTPGAILACAASETSDVGNV
jgi:hypothetical protein